MDAFTLPSTIFGKATDHVWSTNFHVQVKIDHTVFHNSFFQITSKLSQLRWINRLTKGASIDEHLVTFLLYLFNQAI